MVQRGDDVPQPEDVEHLRGHRQNAGNPQRLGVAALPEHLQGEGGFFVSALQCQHAINVLRDPPTIGSVGSVGAVGIELLDSGTPSRLLHVA